MKEGEQTIVFGVDWNSVGRWADKGWDGDEEWCGVREE